MAYLFQEIFETAQLPCDLKKELHLQDATQKLWKLLIPVYKVKSLLIFIKTLDVWESGARDLDGSLTHVDSVLWLL